nr:unnamed protein product [Spirometra erinaceieuropaei]
MMECNKVAYNSGLRLTNHRPSMPMLSSGPGSFPPTLAEGVQLPRPTTKYAKEALRPLQQRPSSLKKSTANSPGTCPMLRSLVILNPVPVCDAPTPVVTAPPQPPPLMPVFSPIQQDCFGQATATALQHPPSMLFACSPMDYAARFYVNGSISQVIEGRAAGYPLPHGPHPLTPHSVFPNGGESVSADRAPLIYTPDLSTRRSVPRTFEATHSPAAAPGVGMPSVSRSPPPLPPRSLRRPRSSSQNPHRGSRGTQGPPLPPPPSRSTRGSTAVMVPVAGGEGIRLRQAASPSPVPTGRTKKHSGTASAKRPSSLNPPHDDRPSSECHRGYGLKPPVSPSGAHPRDTAVVPAQPSDFIRTRKSPSPGALAFKGLQRTGRSRPQHLPEPPVPPPLLSRQSRRTSLERPKTPDRENFRQPLPYRVFPAGEGRQHSPTYASSEDEDEEGCATDYSSDSDSSSTFSNLDSFSDGDLDPIVSPVCPQKSLLDRRLTPDLDTPSPQTHPRVPTASTGRPRQRSPSPASSPHPLPVCPSVVKPVLPAVYRRFIEQKFANVGRVHKEREERQARLEAEMALMGLSEASRAQMRKMLQTKESNYMRMQRARMDESMFIRIKRLGVGAFGWVWLVRKKENRQLYAMKILKKQDVVRRRQLAHVQAERDILAEADSEWVVKLFFSFQDSHALYLVMEYIPGGDMMSLLIKKEIFEEDLTRFYIAELILALESVHRLGFIHRDIKPDNILINRDGHIKLTDFGLCTSFRWTHNSKYWDPIFSNPQSGESNQEGANTGADQQQEADSGNAERDDQLHPMHDQTLDRRIRSCSNRRCARSLVGTPNYIAPEILRRQEYNQACDWWSVGVILYEMLVGRPPFVAQTALDTQIRVVQWSRHLRIPGEPRLHRDAADLIRRLLCDPEDRLADPQQLKKHHFFAEINWEILPTQKPPYVPVIMDELDTSNFDAVDDDVDKEEPEGSQSSASGTFGLSGAPHSFPDFTFKRFFDQDNPNRC